MIRLIPLLGLATLLSLVSACTKDPTSPPSHDGAIHDDTTHDGTAYDTTLHDLAPEFSWPDLGIHDGPWLPFDLKASQDHPPQAHDLLDCTDPCTPGCPLDCVACPSRAGCCTTHKDCISAKKPFCGPKNTCVQCLDSDVCPLTLYHWCYKNTCVQCLNKGHCPPHKPMCVNHRCIPS